MRMLIAAFVLAAMLFVSDAGDVSREPAETETLLMVDAECSCGAHATEVAPSLDYETEALLAEGEVFWRAAEATGSAESIVTDNSGIDCSHGLMVQDRLKIPTAGSQDTEYMDDNYGREVRHSLKMPHAGSLATAKSDDDRPAVTRGPLAAGVRS